MAKELLCWHVMLEIDEVDEHRVGSHLSWSQEGSGYRQKKERFNLHILVILDSRVVDVLNLYLGNPHRSGGAVSFGTVTIAPPLS